MGMGFDKFPSVRRPLWCTFPPVFSVGGYPAYFFWRPLVGIILVSGQRTLFPIPEGVRLRANRELTVFLIALKKNSRHKLVF